MRAGIVCKLFLALILTLLSAVSALAGAATVQNLIPQAWATAGGQRIELSPGQAVEEHYTLHTGANGQLTLRFADGTNVSMGPSTSVEIKEFAFGGDKEPSFNMGITGGAARFVTGAVVSQNPEGFKLTTPLATVGIRGTTLDTIITQDKESFIVRDMSAGHVVTVIGSQDGRSVDISRAGMQVDILRGQPTPPSAQPANADDLAVLPTPDEEGEGGNRANLPHHDVGQQSWPWSARR